VNELLMTLRLINQVTPSAIKIVRSLRDIDRAVERVKTNLTRAGSRFGSFFDGAKKRAEGFRNTLLGIPRAVVNLPNLIGASLVAAGASYAIGAAAFKQTTLKAFEIMVGSQSAGKQLFDQSIQYARVTPFSTQDILGATQKLAQQFSPDEIPALLAAVGDVAAVQGFSPEVMSDVIRALSQIKTLGRLQQDEVNQLSERMVPTVEMYEVLAKRRGVSVPDILKLQEAGGIGSGEAISAILEAIRTQVSGGTLGGFSDIMAKELPGLLSTLKSLPFEIFMDLDITPVKNFLANLVSITDTTEATGKRFKNAINNSFGTLLEKVFTPLANATEPEAIIAWVESLQGKFESYATWWKESSPKIIADAKALGLGVLQGLQLVYSIIVMLAPLLSSLNGGFSGMGDSSLNATGKIIGVGAALLILNSLSFGLLGSLAKLAVSLGTTLVTSLFRLGTYLIWTQGLMRTTFMMDILTSPAGKLAALGGYFTRFGAIAMGVLTALRVAFMGVISSIPVIGWIIAAIVALGAAFIWLYNNVGWFRDGVNAAVSAVGALFVTVFTGMKDLAMSAYEGIITGGNNLVTWFEELPAKLLESATAAGQAIVNGLSQGYQSAKGALAGASDWLWSNTIGRFESDAEIHSPSRYMKWVGSMLSLGLAAGITSAQPLVSDAMGGLGIASTQPFVNTLSTTTSKASSSSGPVFHNTFQITIGEGKSSKDILRDLERELPGLVEAIFRNAEAESNGSYE
jgi:tape measure domain-containing protein